MPLSATSVPPPVPVDQAQRDSYRQLQTFVARISERVRLYLRQRPDDEEQTDHLRHVADRTRWLYYSELQRANPGASVRISEHEDALIQACVLSHDVGKWIPRSDLRALVPSEMEVLNRTFARLKFTPHQNELFLLGVGRRFALPNDGYTPEYDSVHHLVSAYLLATDEALGFQKLDPADQDHLILMIVGHQFGGYFKESLLNISLHDGGVTTGMLMEVSRPDRLQGDQLACAFHDADISDLLFIGSLERRPNREDIYHTGGLVKILMINFTNLIYGVPSAPADLEGCIKSCQGTVHNACKEFITPTAVEHGHQWRREALRFLSQLREKPGYDKLNAALMDSDRDEQVRLEAVRSLARLQAREFLTRAEAEEAGAGA